MLRLSARSAVGPSQMPLSAASSGHARARAVTAAKYSQQRRQYGKSATIAAAASSASASVSSHPSSLRSRLAPARRQQTLRSSTAAAAAAAAAAAPAASIAASVAAAAASAKAAVLSKLAAVLPQTLSQQLARLSPAAALLLSALAAVAAFLLVKKVFDTPSRTYDPANPNVGDEYDAWTRDGILEHYWGEHIHLGYYTPAERAQKGGYLRKDFKRAKVDFVEKMLEWSGVRDAGRPPVRRILDVGCGIGGTSRLLAKAFPEAQVAGITLSTEQVTRATQLALAQGLENVTFRVMDALALEFDPGSFDLVWACESGEHMADKRRYVEQMARAVRPGGTLVIATWCQREAAGEGGADADAAAAGTAPPPPLSASERARLQFLYDEWAHPYFVSVEEYGRLLTATGALRDVAVADWTRPTINTWRHSNWVGVFDPWPVVRAGPRIWYRVLREIVTLERMHRAFACGLMVYGMARAVKREEGGTGGGKEEEVLSMVAA